MKVTSDPTILVVDDEDSARAMLVRVLNRGGYASVRSASSAQEARQSLSDAGADLVLTDMHMPGESGLSLLHHVHSEMPGTATLMITGVDDLVTAEEALSLGAYGYIIKPFRQSDVLIGVSNALRRRDLERHSRSEHERLQGRVTTRTRELCQAITQLELADRDLQASRSETIRRLAVASELHDEETGRHVARMSRYSEVLARALDLDRSECVAIREAAALHDVGKIGIPDEILLKPGALTPDERVVMQQHATIGHRILSGSDSPLLELAATIALTHHEKVDGSGYPHKLTGEGIPVCGRVAAIADVFDALTTNRPYRIAFPLVEAVEMMKLDAGTHFDRDFLDVFWSVLPEVLEIKAAYDQQTIHAHAEPVSDCA